MRFIQNTRYSIPFALLLVSASSLGFAFISQYGFGLLPCVLCIYQRIPFAVIIGLSTIALLLPKRINLTKPLLILCGVIFLVGAGIAVFHVGVEHKWWEGTDKCGGGAAVNSIEALRARILAAPVVRCDEPQFFFLGLTMAGWNVLYSSFLGLLSLIGCRKLQ